MEPTASTAGARCATHPDFPAHTSCERCGAYVCEGCLVIGDYGDLCPRCRAKAIRGDSGSWWAVGSVIAGFLSLGCAPLGILAIGLGIGELVRVAGGGAGRGGRVPAAVAIVLGLAGLVIWVFLGLRIYQQGIDY